jgi:hypothetical protein
MINRALTILSLGLLFAFTSCKPDKDTLAPTIQWIDLQTDSSYFAGDTLYFQVQVSDDKNLDNVRIALEDQLGNNLFTIARNNLGGSSANLLMAFPIPYELATGNYTLVGAVSDGSNERKTYATLAIQFKASPLDINGLFILAQGNGQSILYLRGSNEVANLGDFPIDAGFLKVQASQQKLYLAGANSPTLFCTGTDGSLKWSKTFTDYQPNSSLLDVVCDSSAVYVSTREGFIYGYSSNGIQNLQVQVQSGYYPKNLFVQNGLLLAQLVSPTQPNQLIAYHPQTGLILYQTNFTNLINSFESLDQERLLASSSNTSTGQGKISVINLNSNFYSVQDFDLNPVPQKIVSMQDGSNFLVGTNQGIYRFTYSPNSYVSFTGTGNNEDFVYNPSTNLLYAGNGNTLSLFNTFTSQMSLIISAHPYSRLAVLP